MLLLFSQLFKICAGHLWLLEAAMVWRELFNPHPIKILNKNKFNFENFVFIILFCQKWKFKPI